MAAKHVKPGDDLTIDANVYNAAVDAYLLKNGQQPRGSFRPEQEQQTRIVIRNDTGSDVVAYQPIGFGNPLISPDDDLDGFLDRIILSGHGPLSSYNYQWGLAQEAIPDGDFGEVAVSGLSYAQVQVKSGMIRSAIKFVDPFTAIGPTLVPVNCGMCRVIWLQEVTGTGQYAVDGTVWAIVNLG
ncbi:MAG: hypothetical protein WCH39_07360 [Schlesneria sp.]